MTPQNLPPGIDPMIEDRASVDDRDWFTARPQRRFRLRRRVPGELGVESQAEWVLVAQHAPGLRTRHPLRTTGCLPFNTDDELVHVFDALRRSALIVVQHGHVIPFADLPLTGGTQ
jgi:hypothetical protein